jgi:hypothetical protein
VIAPLRARHRLWTGALAVAVPVLYVLALAARTEPPAVELPPALAEDAFGDVLREMDDLFAEHAVATRVRRGSGGFQVELEPATAIVAPEVLVYWSPSAAMGDKMPAEAFLLGSLAGTRARAFALPAAALGRDGWLLLYSLGHQQVLDAGALAAVGEAVEESR